LFAVHVRSTKGLGMYANRTGQERNRLRARVERAIRLEQPITLTYRETKKDPERAGRRLPDQFEITLRTIEPLALLVSKAGDEYIRSLDRKTGEYRSWRLDRVILYTPHRGVRTLSEALRGAVKEPA